MNGESKARSSIIFSSFCDRLRPGMPSRGLEAANPKVGIGTKSLDRDLDDVHTWPHSHYLVRQSDGVGGLG